MYKSLKTIKAGEFNIVDNKLLYSFQHQVYYNGEVIYNGNPTSFKTFKSTVYVFDNFERLVVINLINKDKKEFGFISGISLFINENDIVYGHYSDDYSIQYRTRINLQSEQKKWTIESYFGNGFILDNYLYASCLNNRICKIDLNHPEQPLWQFNLSQLGRYTFLGEKYPYNVWQFVGIFNDVLWIQLRNFRLLALDIHSGKLIKLIDFHAETADFTQNGGSFFPATMYLVEDKIIWLSGSILIRVNLNSYQTEIIKTYHQAPRKEQWIFQHNTYHKGKIYFVADYGNQYVTASYIGVMDANTGEILWWYQQKTNAEFNQAPQVNDTHLYVLSPRGFLYIFEKQTDKQV